MMELRNICKIYRMGQEDFYALNNVSLTINDGEFLSICGASGSGKTTLLNILGCLDTFERGQYILDDSDIARLRDEGKSRIRNAKIGFVLQDFALIQSQTVLYNVMLPLLFSKHPYRTLKSKAMEALEIVGMPEQAHKKANQLSGGQKQRVAIARALVNDPSIILADEPTGQLDSKTSTSIMELLRQMNQRGITVVVVTHDATVASFATRKIQMADGKIISDVIMS